MAVMIARLDALKHSAQVRVQVDRELFRMVAAKPKVDAVRAAYRVWQGTFEFLRLSRDKVAGSEMISGGHKWCALQKACRRCMASSSRRGVRI